MNEYAPGAATIDQEQIPGSLDVLAAKLDAARTEWAGISAKRHARVSDYNRRGELKVIHGYNQAQATYNDLVVEYGRRSLDEQLSATDDETERNAIAIGYIVDMQNRLNEETEAIRDRSLLRRLGRKAGEWLNTGGRYAKIAKSMGVTIVGGLLGGKIGGAIAGGAVRGVKAYYGGDVSGLASVRADEFHEKFINEAEGDDTAAEANAALERAQALAAREYDAAGLDQQAKKKAGLKRSLGAVATGALIGGTIGAVIHAAPDLFPATQAHALGDGASGNGANLELQAETPAANLPLDARADNLSLASAHANNLSIGDEVSDGANLTVEDPVQIEGNNLPLESIDGDNNLQIDQTPDDGGNLDSENTPSDGGSNLPIGPEAAYGNNLPLEEVGADGNNLPLEERGGHNLPLASEAEVNDAPVEYDNELPVIDRGEGINSFVADNYGYHLSPEQSEALGHELHEADGGYVYSSEYLQDTFGNEYGLSHPGQIDTGMNAIIEDIVADGDFDADYQEFSRHDWAQIEDMLDRAASQDALSDIAAHDSSLMDDIGPVLQDMHYEDGSDIVTQDSYGHWSFSDTSEALPQDARDAVYRYVNTSDQAAEKMLQLTRVL